MLILLRKGLWQMANQQWNVCIPFAKSNSSVPIATVCWDGWCSYSNRANIHVHCKIPKSLLNPSFTSLQTSKRGKKNRIILFFEWIKTLLKILELKDPLQTTGARTCFPDTNCLIPWFPSPHWLKTIPFFLKESCLGPPPWVMFGSLQLLQVPLHSSAAHSHS